LPGRYSRTSGSPTRTCRAGEGGDPGSPPTIRRSRDAAAAIRAEGVEGRWSFARIDRSGNTAAAHGDRRLLAGYTFLDAEEAAKRAKDVEFLLDCLYCPDPAARRVAARRLAAVAARR